MTKRPDLSASVAALCDAVCLAKALQIVSEDVCGGDVPDLTNNVEHYEFAERLAVVPALVDVLAERLVKARSLLSAAMEDRSDA